MKKEDEKITTWRSVIPALIGIRVFIQQHPGTWRTSETHVWAPSPRDSSSFFFKARVSLTFLGIPRLSSKKSNRCIHKYSKRFSKYLRPSGANKISSPYQFSDNWHMGIHSPRTNLEICDIFKDFQASNNLSKVLVWKNPRQLINTQLFIQF